MNYLTDLFSPSRLVPSRNMSLDSVGVERWPDRSLPLIADGQILVSVPSESRVVGVDERTLAVNGSLYESPDFIYGPGGLKDRTFLVQDEIGGDMERLTIRVVDLEQGTSRVLTHGEPITMVRGTTVVSGKYIFRDLRGGWVAVDSSSGEICWRALSARECVTYAADANSNCVVSVGADFVVSCLDLTSGAVKWQRRPADLGLAWGTSYAGRRINVYPHIFQDLVVVAMPGQQIVGLNLSDGSLIWNWKAEREADPYSYHPCVTEDGEILHIANGALYQVSAATGQGRCIGQISGYGSDSGFEINAVFCDVTTTHVWGVTHTGVIYAVSRETAAIEWFTDLGAKYALGHPFVLCNNRIYVQTTEDQFVIHGGGGYRLD